MSPQMRILRTYGLWMVDTAAIIIAYLIATILRYAGRDDYGDRRLHYLAGLLFVLLYTINVFVIDPHRDVHTRGYLREIIVIVKQMVTLSVVTLTVVFFLHWSSILSRTVIINFAWICTTLMICTHFIFKRLMRSMIVSEQMAVRVLVLTDPERMEEVRDSLLDLEEEGYIVVDCVSVQEQDVTTNTVTIPFDEVYIDTAEISSDDLQEIIEGYEAMGVICRYRLNLPHTAESATRVESFGDHTVVTYSRFKSSHKRLLIKRAFDIFGGLVGSIVTILLGIVLIPLIRLDSKGKAVFSQTRIGRNGRRFTIYKFRSMYADAEERLAELKANNEMSGLMFKMENDPRITRIGRFLRKTSLDEFPQFFNVLKGEMSLVGTRPPTEDEFAQYSEHYRRRLSMSPGLTGLWQVSGRSSIKSFDDVVKLDLRYIDNWSLSLDLKILFKTIVVVFVGRGAK